MRFRGRSVIVTGAAGGIGRETAVRFAAEGATVVGADLDAAGGEETAELCRRHSGRGSFVRTDVAVEADIEQLVEHCVAETGRVDILFNNAGVVGAVGPIETVPNGDWDRTFAINVRSVFFGIKHVVPLMKLQGRGAIVSTSSVAGRRGFPFAHAYCATKTAIVSLTRSAAVELGPYRIRVKCVCPGDVVTAMQGDLSDAGSIAERLAERQPIGRAGQPYDIAAAVLFLASDEADWLTGEALTIDGGMLAGVWAYAGDIALRDIQTPAFVGSPSEGAA